MILESKGLGGAAENILKNMIGDRYVNLLRDLFIDCLPDRKAQIEIAFVLLIKLRTQRNETLHWLYGKFDNSTLAVNALARPYRQRQERNRTAEQIQAIADGFLDMTMLVSEWHMRSLGLPWPPSLDTIGREAPV